MRQRLLAEKRERERELLKKKIAAGIDFLGEGTNIKIGEEKKE